MARSFDGVNDGITFGTNAAFNVTVGTACAWVKFPLTFTAERQILAKTTAGFIAKQFLQANTTVQNSLECFFHRATTNMSSVSSANTLTAAVWNLVISTFDGSAAPKLYVGLGGPTISEVTYASQSAGSGAFANTSTASLQVGTRDPLDAFWNGEIGQVALWSVILTEGERNRLSQGEAPCSIQQNSLQLYAPLDLGESPEPNISPLGGTGTVTEATFQTGPVLLYHPRCLAFPTLLPQGMQ